jgi:hypothetical protein
MQHLASPVRMDTTSGNMLANRLATPADQLPNRNRQNYAEMLDATLASTSPGGTDESNLYTGKFSDKPKQAKGSDNNSLEASKHSSLDMVRLSMIVASI